MPNCPLRGVFFYVEKHLGLYECAHECAHAQAKAAVNCLERQSLAIPRFSIQPVVLIKCKVVAAMVYSLTYYVGGIYVRSEFTCKVVAAMVYSVAYYVGGFYVRSEFSYKAAPA